MPACCIILNPDLTAVIESLGSVTGGTSIFLIGWVSIRHLDPEDHPLRHLFPSHRMRPSERFDWEAAISHAVIACGQGLLKDPFPECISRGLTYAKREN